MADVIGTPSPIVQSDADIIAALQAQVAQLQLQLIAAAPTPIATSTATSTNGY